MEELKTLNNAIHCLKVGADMAVCEDCNLYECHHTDVKDIALVAIKALEKQIPKKVLKFGKYGFNCPCCKEDLGLESEDIFIFDMTPPKYCDNCGQKLDWE